MKTTAPCRTSFTFRKKHRMDRICAIVLAANMKKPAGNGLSAHGVDREAALCVCWLLLVQVWCALAVPNNVPSMASRRRLSEGARQDIIFSLSQWKPPFWEVFAGQVLRNGRVVQPRRLWGARCDTVLYYVHYKVRPLGKLAAHRCALAGIVRRTHIGSACAKRHSAPVSLC